MVVMAGSFNPPHNGHLASRAILEYLSKRYGQEVIVVIGVNLTKKYLVSPVHVLDSKKILS